MSTLDVHGNRPGTEGAVASPHELRKTAEVVGGGAAIEAIGGAGAVVLAIIGLARILPVYMACIAAIGLGAALVFEGAAIAARFSKVVRETGGGRVDEAEIGGGMSTEFLGGIAGIVLGVLALLGLDAMILLPVAAIVFGGSLILGSGATSRLNSIALWGYQGAGTYSGGGTYSTLQEVARDAVMSAAATQILVGLGGLVLGILALVGFQPLMLSLVAFLGMGAAVLFSGSALATRMATVFRR